jgi:flagellar basal body-associated protein FliL
MIVLIVLVVLLLGAVGAIGYFLYSKGVLDEKGPQAEEAKKEIQKEEAKASEDGT